MITVKDFVKKSFDEEKHIKDLVEKKLSEILGNSFEYKEQYSFVIDEMDKKYLNGIIKELESRGFTDVKSEIMMNDVIKFYFSIHFNEVSDFNEPKKMMGMSETENVIKNNYKEIANQLVAKNKAEIIFTADFLENTCDNKKFIHWWNVGKILKDRLGYVAMERLDKNLCSVEETIQSSIFPNCDVRFFKFIIWRSVVDYNRDYDTNKFQYFN